MRNIPGRKVSVNGHMIYIEETGKGNNWVVFEAGMWGSRTVWDKVVPLLQDDTHILTYDRIGYGRSEQSNKQTSIVDMASTLVQLIELIVPDKLVLVAHSMGGLIARYAAKDLSSRLNGMLLIDPSAETASEYDDGGVTYRKHDRMFALMQVLVQFPPLRRLLTRPIGRLFTRDTYEAMLSEKNFTPSGVKQARRELAALQEAISTFRRQPLQPPKCKVILLSADRTSKLKAPSHADLQAQQRRYIESIENGHFERIDSEHTIQAEQPELVATRIRQLLVHSS